MKNQRPNWSKIIVFPSKEAIEREEVLESGCSLREVSHCGSAIVQSAHRLAEPGAVEAPVV